MTDSPDRSGQELPKKLQELMEKYPEELDPGNARDNDSGIIKECYHTPEYTFDPSGAFTSKNMPFCRVITDTNPKLKI